MASGSAKPHRALPEITQSGKSKSGREEEKKMKEGKRGEETERGHDKRKGRGEDERGEQGQAAMQHLPWRLRPRPARQHRLPPAGAAAGPNNRPFPLSCLSGRLNRRSTSLPCASAAAVASLLRPRLPGRPRYTSILNSFR